MTERARAADLAGRPLSESASTLVRMPALSSRLPTMDDQEERAYRREVVRRRDKRWRRAECEAAEKAAGETKP